MHLSYLPYILSALCATVAERTRYDGFRLYRIIPTDSSSYGILSEMLADDGYSFWSGVRGIDSPVDVMVSPDKLAEFESLVNGSRLKNVQEMMSDVQKYIDEENPLAGHRGAFGWRAYHKLEVINQWMDSLAEEYPNIISPLVGGQSYEGRKILGLKLSFGEGKPGVFLEGGIHAREWISPAVVTYILNELVTSQEPSVRRMAESYDWYIFPNFNPDGYVYTHQTNRLWRKTRQPYSPRCVGADPNRNWNFHWRDGGASTNPCSETFAGSSPFSERETKTMSEFISSIRDKIFAYIGFHSYSQLLLIPYGHSNAHIENYDDLMKIGNASAKALQKRYGTRYKVGNIVDVIYVASGGSMDWVRGSFGTPIVYTYELRDKGRYGFLLPASQIIPTGEETLDSLVAMFQEAEGLGYGKYRPPAVILQH